MNRWSGRVAVVTGSSSGIGEAISIELVKHGIIVAGLARRIEKLQALSARLNTGDEKKFHPFKCDLTKAEEIVDCFKQIRDRLGPISILINNAGYLGIAALLDVTTEQINQILQTNVAGLTLCSKEAINSMIDNKIDDGHIVTINSIAGHCVPNFGPGVSQFSVYIASKHAVTALMDCLRKELRARRTKIKSTSISPGLVRTEMTAGFNPEHIVPLEASDIAEACVNVLATSPNVLITELTLMPVDENP